MWTWYRWRCNLKIVSVVFWPLKRTYRVLRVWEWALPHTSVFEIKPFILSSLNSLLPFAPHSVLRYSEPLLVINSLESNIPFNRWRHSFQFCWRHPLKKFFLFIYKFFFLIFTFSWKNSFYFFIVYAYVCCTKWHLQNLYFLIFCIQIPYKKLYKNSYQIFKLFLRYFLYFTLVLKKNLFSSTQN